MYENNDKAKANELQYRWGGGGQMILEAGAGGGFTSLPYVLDDYERALGLERDEMWLIKRLLRNYWKPGEAVFPSFRKIERQANIGRKKLIQLRRQLESKGLIKVDVQRDENDSRMRIDLSPLFYALALCILCDPQSKIARQQRHSDIRKAITELLGNDVDLYSWFPNKRLVEDAKLPLSVETAQGMASRLGISLDWKAISQMQGQAEKAVKKDTEHYERLMLIRASVKAAADETFKVNWNFEKAFDLLKWLDERVTSDEVYTITKEYTQNLQNSTSTHRFRDFDRFIRKGVNTLKQGGGVAVNTRGVVSTATPHIQMNLVSR